MISKLESKVINKYGYEHNITIAVFKLTNIVRKICK